MRPVIYLDIDGVLATERSYLEKGQDGKLIATSLRKVDGDDWPDWDRECMSNFQELLYHIHYHFSLCISSTWRQFAQTPAEFSAIAARRGLYLPTNYYHEDWRTGFRLSSRPRLYEILEHVEDNKVKNFLILDDDVQHERCPVTDFDTGFTRTALEKAKEILDEQFNRNRN